MLANKLLFDFLALRSLLVVGNSWGQSTEVQSHHLSDDACSLPSFWEGRMSDDEPICLTLWLPAARGAYINVPKSILGSPSLWISSPDLNWDV